MNIYPEIFGDKPIIDIPNDIRISTAWICGDEVFLLSTCGIIFIMTENDYEWVAKKKVIDEYLVDNWGK